MKVDTIADNRFIGRKLNINIYTKQESLLLAKNCILTSHHLDLLQQHGIELWDEDIQLVEEIIIDMAVIELKSIHEKLLHDPLEVTLQSIQKDFLLLLNKLFARNHIVGVMKGLCKKDDYTYRHCIGVSVLSGLIGKWLGLGEKERDDLLISGLLHDIGKIKIPGSILHKTGPLTSEEYAEMKLHTHYGYQMIRSIPGMTEEHALVALQHHEREDGSGYPFGATRTDINPSSKIVAVADVFHTMVSERVYKKPKPLYQVLQELDRCAYSSLHPKIVRTMISGVMHQMIGELVVLSNGKLARILMLHQDDLIKPLVEIDGDYYDLRKNTLEIVDFQTTVFDAGV